MPLAERLHRLDDILSQAPVVVRGVRWENALHLGMSSFHSLLQQCPPVVRLDDLVQFAVEYQDGHPRVQRLQAQLLKRVEVVVAVFWDEVAPWETHIVCCNLPDADEGTLQHDPTNVPSHQVTRPLGESKDRPASKRSSMKKDLLWRNATHRDAVDQGMERYVLHALEADLLASFAAGTEAVARILHGQEVALEAFCHLDQVRLDEEQILCIAVEEDQGPLC
mmetsp:Transcript_57625/g.135017  ORF Transcript_57625/g.135017 Transcript_57625/m.135017 type:complete len:222 (+) Transcript_57625:248-913(+)